MSKKSNKSDNLKELACPDGKILLFDPENHIYYYEDKKVDNVTTLLSIINKPGLIYWGISLAIKKIKEWFDQVDSFDDEELNGALMSAKEEHQKELDRTSKLGTKIHKAIENYIKEGTEPTDEEVMPAFKQFKRFEEIEDIEFLEAEIPVFYKEYWYCGQIDILAKYKGRLVIADIKTSSGIHDTYCLQTAAYQRAYENNSGSDIDGRLIIRISRDGKDLETYYTEDIENDFFAFLNASSLTGEIKRISKDIRKNKCSM